MKIRFIKLAIITSLVFAFAGCKDDGEVKNLRVTPVKHLYEPDNGRDVILQSSDQAVLYFEWEPARAEDSGMVLYEIAFDKVDGDFSNPVFITASAGNGKYNNANIPHKQLNKIAAAIGIESDEIGTFKWTVFSSKGVNAVKAEEERNLTVKRLAGFADVPVNVYVTGEASEGGTDLSKAHQMKAIDEGEFEVYTKLTGGQTYYFTDAITGTPRQFYIAGDLLEEGDLTITAPKTSVYRINLDFTAGNAVLTEITSFKLFFCPSNDDIFELPYIGYGVFKASAQPVTFHQESWGRDERYKFRMYIVDGAGESIEYWGTKNSTDSRPEANSPESYYHITKTPNNQWDQKWKFAGEMDNALVDVTAYFRIDGEYTHEVKKVGDQ